MQEEMNESFIIVVYNLTTGKQEFKKTLNGDYLKACEVV